MKKIIWVITVALFLFVHCATFAQDSTQVKAAKPTKAYKLAMGIQLTGIGFGIANPKGFTFKYFISDKSALEYVLTPGGRNIVGTSILYLRHFPIQDTPKLNWYGGVGTNLDVYRYEPITGVNEPVKTKVTTTTTMLAILGAEYNFPDAPFTISGDIKSGIFGYSGFGADNRYNTVYGLRPSISFRYKFKS